MRYLRIATGVLLLGMMGSSCTCEKAVPPVPTAQDRDAFSERESGIAKKTPQKVAATTPTPKVEQVAAATTPTVPPELPKDFPSEVPVYAGAQLSGVQDLANNGHNVIFNSTGSVTDITKFYHDKLSKAGWQATQQFDRPNHAFMTYKKGNLLANVTIAEDSRNPGQQIIAVMYEEQKPLDFDEF
ncbi:MAG TPA: hypothetical protein VMT89_13680 [Candidatus Acidoferrales bacterium]|nr:hypothetical protein [Candidatus Acidoferrales bacterium]